MDQSGGGSIIGHPYEGTFPFRNAIRNLTLIPMGRLEGGGSMGGYGHFIATVQYVHRRNPESENWKIGLSHHTSIQSDGPGGVPQLFIYPASVRNRTQSQAPASIGEPRTFAGFEIIDAMKINLKSIPKKIIKSNKPIKIRKLNQL